MLSEITAIVREAGEIVRNASDDKDVHEKSGHADLVTKYDTAVQQFLAQRLLELLPEAGFLGEESTDMDAHLEREYLFIVDPIDGTTNFVKDFRHSAICVALAHRGEVILGVVYNPYLDEMFTAERGRGAWLNGKPIRASDCGLEQAIAACGTAPYRKDYGDMTFFLIRQMFDRCLDVRRLASAALDLCYLAAGRVDVYFECSLAPWDYAAAGLIAREAGALVADFRGEPPRLDGTSSIAAANPKCYGTLLELIAESGFPA